MLNTDYLILYTGYKVLFLKLVHYWISETWFKCFFSSKFNHLIYKMGSERVTTQYSFYENWICKTCKEFDTAFDIQELNKYLFVDVWQRSLTSFVYSHDWKYVFKMSNIYVPSKDWLNQRSCGWSGELRIFWMPHRWFCESVLESIWCLQSATYKSECRASFWTFFFSRTIRCSQASNTDFPKDRRETVGDHYGVSH